MKTISFVLMLALPVIPAQAAELIQISGAQQKNLGIQTQTLARSGEVQLGWPAKVTIPPGNLRMVVAPVSGMVTRMSKGTAEPVRSGEFLAVLSSTELLAEQRGLITAQTRQKLARDNAARDEKLFAEGIIAESRLRASRAELVQAQAEYGVQRAALKAYGLGEQTIDSASDGKLSTSLGVSSQISGVVLEQLAEVGSRVETGMPLYKLANLSRLVLEIQLPAKDANTLKLGQAVSVAGSQATGKVTAIGAQVGGAQTVTVRADLRDPQNRLLPGQSVEARLAVGMNGGGWRVPAQAIAWQGGKPYVFAATAQGYRAVPVQVLSQTSQDALIGGLKDGERIAVSGLAALKSLWQAGGE